MGTTKQAAVQYRISAVSENDQPNKVVRDNKQPSRNAGHVDLELLFPLEVEPHLTSPDMRPVELPPSQSLRSFS